jgi:hypothetical protein
VRVGRGVTAPPTGVIEGDGHGDGVQIPTSSARLVTSWVGSGAHISCHGVHDRRQRQPIGLRARARMGCPLWRPRRAGRYRPANRGGRWRWARCRARRQARRRRRRGGRRRGRRRGRSALHRQATHPWRPRRARSNRPANRGDRWRWRRRRRAEGVIASGSHRRRDVQVPAAGNDDGREQQSKQSNHSRRQGNWRFHVSTPNWLGDAGRSRSVTGWRHVVDSPSAPSINSPASPQTPNPLPSELNR